MEIKILSKIRSTDFDKIERFMIVLETPVEPVVGLFSKAKIALNDELLRRWGIIFTTVYVVI